MDEPNGGTLTFAATIRRGMRRIKASISREVRNTLQRGKEQTVPSVPKESPELEAICMTIHTFKK